MWVAIVAAAVVVIQQRSLSAFTSVLFPYSWHDDFASVLSRGHYGYG